jgi:hypothetical protein
VEARAAVAEVGMGVVCANTFRRASAPAETVAGYGTEGGRRHA